MLYKTPTVNMLLNFEKGFSKIKIYIAFLRCFRILDY